MRYDHICFGKFISRPNRFIAMVELDGETRACHVKNTGRCRELLTPGARVVLCASDNPGRRTKHDLIAVYKGNLLVNMDSQAPNRVAEEYLAALRPDALIRREVEYGDSRLDFCLDGPEGRTYVEVKGVTLEDGGTAYFPDAPTLRGVKHLRELIRARREGYTAMLLFVVQMEGMREVHPNEHTHPDFGRALRDAAAVGVELRAIVCHVAPDSLLPGEEIPVHLYDERPDPIGAS